MTEYKRDKSGKIGGVLTNIKEPEIFIIIIRKSVSHDGATVE
jgi:hypothetical protein